VKHSLSVLIILCMAISALAEDAPRQIINFNREWKFLLGDHPGADALTYDDTAWSNIGLPHSFSIPYFASPQFYVGYGWYRKHFDAPPAWHGKRVFLEFDGAFQDAELFVNGHRIGEHKGGYTGFTFDISGAIKTGDNLVAVRLNNNWDPRLAPRAGEHVFSGGIYRDVRMVVTDPLHITWYGTFVTTPQLTAQSGVVDVKTEIRNDDPAPRSALLKTQIIDPSGKVIATLSTVTKDIPPSSTVTVDQTSRPIPHPQLWHPDHPFLYRTISSVYDQTSQPRLADQFPTTFGFRWFKFTADQGFFLNGEHYYFKGANVHQDHAGWGDAVTQAGAHRDVALVKQAGFDFIRGSHYPHSPAFVSACDELGVLFWSENCLWGLGGRSPDGYWDASAYPIDPADDADFEASVKQQLAEEIRIHRNHPSVIVWSMSNEPYFSAKQVLPQLRTLLSSLVTLSHQLDPTRPAAIGGAQRGDIDKLGDIAGYNGDGAKLFINPGIPSVVTEYSSVRAIRPGKYGPAWGNLVEGPGDRSQPYFWRYPWRSGESLWCAFDHGSVAGDEGRTGIIDYFRLPKRQWYWYRNEYAKIPPPPWPVAGTPAGLRLSADKTTLKSVDGTDDAQIIVTVVDAAGHQISNSPPVTLTVASGPGEFPTGPSIAFAEDSDIAIHDGQAAMEFRSYYAGSTVIRATSPGLPDATITILSLGQPAFIPGTTPPVQPRPYVRFSDPKARSAASKRDSIFGINNPSTASSESPGHPARFGDDADDSTAWQPLDSDTTPSWQVDLERSITMSQCIIDFPISAIYHYKIETSADGSHWTLAADHTQANRAEKTATDKLPRNTTAHLLRITFSGRPAAISDVEIAGHLSTQ
jgi:beta-galactosidase